MYAYKEYLVNGHCPYCNRDLSIHINNLKLKVIHECVDCMSRLTILPTNALYAEIFDECKRRVIGDVSPVGRDCCG